ncbi:MAG: VanZ family protein [Betaproteobacteria bacterium]|nr:VanZ family protein [Betaproteobacteria bacterium]
METRAETLMRWLAGATLAAMIAAVFIGGRIPGINSYFPAPWDKLLHLTAYGVAALLLTIVLRGRRPWLVLLAVMAAGFADEFHQAFIPGRHAGLDDILANFVGAGMVCFGSLVSAVTAKAAQQTEARRSG